MGAKIVIPEADANITKVIRNFHLTPKDISDFWKLFQKLDKEKTGLVSLTIIFKEFEMERNLFTDCLMELLEIEHDGEINFSDFLFMVCTYCFFEPVEILRFCFYCFDQDKTGFFSIDDLNRLMNVVHNIKLGKTVSGTVKSSWMKLEFEGEQIDFKEFSNIHNNFPRILEPAFRLQQFMMTHTMGEVWWTLKKRALQNEKDADALKVQKLEERKEKRRQQKRNKKIQRNMGLLKYYMCPCFRKYYDPASSELEKLSQEEKEERERQLKILRRQNELKIKNPETADWLKYQKKIQSDLETIEEDQDFDPKKVKEQLEQQRREAAEAKQALLFTPKAPPGTPTATVAAAAAAAASTTASPTPDSKGGRRNSKDVVPASGGGGGGRRGSNSSAQSKQSGSVLSPRSSVHSEDELESMEDDIDLQIPTTYLGQKIDMTSRPREERAMGRAERREVRKQMLKGPGKK